MKLIKKAVIDGEPYKIVSDTLQLEIFSNARGILTIQSAEPVSGEVKIYIGYDGEFSLYFSGYVTSSQAMDSKQQRITVRDFADVLNHDHRMSLRHVSAKDVIANMAEIDGLDIILDDDATLQNFTMPNFINTSTGFHALDLIGDELPMEQFYFESMPDGSLWCGEWQNSKAGKAGVFSFPAEMLTNISAVGASLPVLPWLRPGVKIKVGNAEPIFVSKVEMQGSSMRMNWNLNPWSEQR